VDVVKLIITEDSDLILFGCEKILFKMKIEMIDGKDTLYGKGKLSSATGFDSFERFRW
jgi:hypothetical protein